MAGQPWVFTPAPSEMYRWFQSFMVTDRERCAMRSRYSVCLGAWRVRTALCHWLSVRVANETMFGLQLVDIARQPRSSASVPLYTAGVFFVVLATGLASRSGLS